MMPSPHARTADLISQHMVVTNEIMPQVVGN